MFIIKNVRKFGVCFLALAFVLMFYSITLAKDEVKKDKVGQVLMLNPGAWANRGELVPLAVKSAVFKQDTIQTDQSGKAQILLLDDTTITVGLSTSVIVQEFVEQGDSSNFLLEMSKGVAQVVTGKLVKANPDGFVVHTPHATVGIRGTVVTIGSDEKGTTVVADNITTNNVTVVNTLTGQVSSLNFSGAGVSVSPEGNETFTQPSNAPVLHQGINVAATTEEKQAEQADETNQSEQVAQADQVVTEQTVQTEQMDQSFLGNSLVVADNGDSALLNNSVLERLPETVLPGVNVSNISGAFSGYLLGNSPALTGTLGFNVALGSGAISGGQMSVIEDHGLAASARNGSGQISSDGSFIMNNWGAIEVVSSPGSSALVDGKFNTETNFDFDWVFKDSSGSILNSSAGTPLTGTGEGSKDIPSPD